MARTMTYSDTLTVIDCCSCGMPFGVPTNWEQKRRADGGGFYCPNGHDLIFRESDVKRLERELAAANQKIASERARRLSTQDQLEATERSRSAVKGQLTKVKNRIQKGVCPHCNRHFENVQRHMASKHPEET